MVKYNYFIGASIRLGGKEMVEVELFTIPGDATIREALETINKNGYGIVVIVDKDNKVLGVLTDGDIRRALLKGFIFNQPITDIYNRDFLYVTDPVDYSKLQRIISSEKFRNRFKGADNVKLLVLTKDNRLKDIISVNVKTLAYRSIISGKMKGEYKIRRILVTGGAGYIGSVLVRKLLDNDYKVFVLDNLLYGDVGIRGIKNQNFTLIKGDIANVKDVIVSLESIDAIVHLAAIVGDPASRVIPKETIETNYFATVVLAEAARYFGVRKLVFASTCSVYGASNTEELLTEESPLNPISLYAETKLRSEDYLRRVADESFSPVILRFGTAFGYSPRMRFDLVINLLTAMAFFEKSIKIFGGDQWRPFVHIKDISDAIIKSIIADPTKVSGEVFNIVGENIKIIQLGELIKKHIPDTKVEVIKEARDLRSYKVSGEKAKEILGFTPKITVEDGIKEILEVLKSGKIQNYKDEVYSNYKKIKSIMEQEGI